MSRQSSAAPPLPVLITRPAPQAARFAAELRQSFGDRVDPVLSPLMRAVTLPVTLPETALAALILSSETGAQAAGQLRAILPSLAYCVGDRTAAAAAAAGFQTRSAAGDAGDLLALILAEPDLGPLLYLHGRDRAADLSAQLAPLGRAVLALPIYAQEAEPLSPVAQALLAKPSPLILPLFSPRSASLFFAEAGPIQADLYPVVISENTLRQLPQIWAERAEQAAHPDAPSMLAAIARQLQRCSP